MTTIAMATILQAERTNGTSVLGADGPSGGLVASMLARARDNAADPGTPAVKVTISRLRPGV